MTSVFWNNSEQPCFQNHILVLPSVAVGNVGQLAVDLLLNNLNVEHLGSVHHSCFLPIVGADPFNPDQTRLTTSCEIYECKEKELVIIQQRSPVVLHKVSEYRTLMINFIKQYKFKMTILLTSCFSQFFTIEDLQGVPLHYLCTQNVMKEEETFSTLSWKKFVLPAKIDAPETSAIPGGGIAKFLLKDCEEENIPLAVLIFVCSEGNNYPEAVEMVKNLNLWLQLKKDCDISEIWKMPISWSLPYGSAAPHTIY